jgi:hypothetical protein
MARSPRTTAAASSIIQPLPIPARRSTPVTLSRRRLLRFRSSFCIASSSNAPRSNRPQSQMFLLLQRGRMKAGRSPWTSRACAERRSTACLRWSTTAALHSYQSVTSTLRFYKRHPHSYENRTEKENEFVREIRDRARSCVAMLRSAVECVGLPPRLLRRVWRSHR